MTQIKIFTEKTLFTCLVNDHLVNAFVYALEGAGHGRAGNNGPRHNHKNCLRSVNCGLTGPRAWAIRPAGSCHAHCPGRKARPVTASGNRPACHAHRGVASAGPKGRGDCLWGRAS